MIPAMGKSKNLNPTDGTKFVVALDRNQLNVVIQALEMYQGVAVGDMGVVERYHDFNTPTHDAMVSASGADRLTEYKVDRLGLTDETVFPLDHESVSPLVSLARDVRLSLRIARVQVENPTYDGLAYIPVFPDVPRASVMILFPEGGTTEQKEEAAFAKSEAELKAKKLADNANLTPATLSELSESKAVYAPYIPLQVTPLKGAKPLAEHVMDAVKAKTKANIKANPVAADTMQDLGTPNPTTKKLVAKWGSLLAPPSDGYSDLMNAELAKMGALMPDGKIVPAQEGTNSADIPNKYGFPIVKSGSGPGDGLFQFKQVSFEPMVAPKLSPAVWGAEVEAMQDWKASCETQPIAYDMEDLDADNPGNSPITVNANGSASYTDAQGVLHTLPTLADALEYQEQQAETLAPPKKDHGITAVFADIQAAEAFNHKSGYNASDIVAMAIMKRGESLLSIKLYLLELGMKHGKLTHEQRVAVCKHVNMTTKFNVEPDDLYLTEDEYDANLPEIESITKSYDIPIAPSVLSQEMTLTAGGPMTVAGPDGVQHEVESGAKVTVVDGKVTTIDGKAVTPADFQNQFASTTTPVPGGAAHVQAPLVTLESPVQSCVHEPLLDEDWLAEIEGRCS